MITLLLSAEPYKYGVVLMWKMIVFASGVVVPDGVCTEGFFFTQNACSVSGNSWFYLSDGLEDALRLVRMG